MAGFFPSLVLSKLTTTVLFNDASKIKVFSGISVRQTLITCQIALSIGLIMCGVMVHKQYQFALNFDLGYETENIVNIRLKGDYAQLLQNEYAKQSDVVATSRSSVALGTREMMPADAMSIDYADTVMFSCNYVDAAYLPMHGFELLAGKWFAQSLSGATPNSIIVNEQLLNLLKLGSPHEAIGKEIWYFGEAKLQIQGVVRDFISMSLDAGAPDAFGFLNAAGEGGILGVKIVTGDLFATMTKLEKIYKKIDPVHPFEATFYDDEIARTYERNKTTYTIISFLAFLAISISTLGLLGMAVFALETRMKELSIRKVLGAGIGHLALLLSKSFIVMIAVAAVVAIPATLYIINDLLLNEFLYRSEIGMVEIFSGCAVVVLIGMITVVWQVRTAAAHNPADLLRDE